MLSPLNLSSTLLSLHQHILIKQAYNILSNLLLKIIFSLCLWSLELTIPLRRNGDTLRFALIFREATSNFFVLLELRYEKTYLYALCGSANELFSSAQGCIQLKFWSYLIIIPVCFEAVYNRNKRFRMNFLTILCEWIKNEYFVECTCKQEL